MANFTQPGVTDFKNYFVRDFPYGSDSSTIMDIDITNAEQDAAIFINQNLFQDQQSFNIGFLLLAAHFLVITIRSSSQGIQGQYPWIESSKSVGSVSEAFAIPQRILDNPEYAMLAKTNYGAKFLFFILPQLTGQMFTVFGCTNP